jgi:regulatory protein
VADAVVADLEGRGYVNDRAFATTWAEVRARERAVGRERLRAELRARGVGRAVAAAAIERAFAETDELSRARAAALRRVPALGRGAPGQVARRLHDYLRRRGYPGDVARTVVRLVCRGAVPEEAVDP